ncbi:NAD(P)-dependent oxidoreductase [Croceibacterium ferulae]|uniref:NAD(P)-dependent oxidoreductase n=1 Tax=Croceibacterium ferulae TaxID=1854641 RepID=UPI000EAB986A|nr:NAD(P)-dependent oxidoreductase [Croceibacterium ferulae]
MKVGFIGLGRMGSAMAANLLKAGHDLAVWNRSPEKPDPLVEAGARRATSPRDAADADVVMSMLADDAAAEAAVYGEDGILGSAAIHVSHSTISVALADRLAADHRGGRGFISAPVFGRPVAAETGQLVVVAAGPADQVATCEPLFMAVGQRLFRVGARP